MASPRNINDSEAPELANIGRNMAFGFSVVVLTLMLVVAVTGSLFYSRVHTINDQKLEKTITEVLAHSINRISFSGKYHARLLVEQITKSQPIIAFITIVDSQGTPIANSSEKLNIKDDLPLYTNTVRTVLANNTTVFTDSTFNDMPIRQISMPYRSGYQNKVNGVIFVGISIEEAKHAEMLTHLGIASIILFLSVISLLITYFLSKHFANPVIRQAWQFKRILEAAPLLVFITDRSGNIRNSSTLFSSLPKEDAHIIDSVLSDNEGNHDNIEREVHCSIQGNEHTFLATRFPVLKDDFDEVSLTCSIAMDITKLKQVEQALLNSEERFRSLYNDNPLMLFTINQDKTIKSVNQFGLDQLGFSKAQLLGKSVYQLFVPEDQETAKSYFEQCFLEPNKVHKWELRKKLGDGGDIFVHETARVVIDNNSAPIALVVCEDISVRKETEEQLIYHASHDMLTGLLNRREFELQAQKLISVSSISNIEHALCYLDLDQFKVVNDTCGHNAGDELLRQLSAALQKKVRRNDSLARLGGDEFGILMEDCTLSDAHRLAKLIQQTVKDFQFSWNNQTLRVGVSIGLVKISKESTDLTELLKEADAACYMAKDLGRNRIHIYQTDDSQIVKRHGEMQWVNRIQHALETNSFCLYAQVITALDNSTEKHYEFLVRMIDEQGNTVPPGLSLPAAERFDLISRIDYWVVSTSFKALAEHPNFLKNVNFISINLSGASLANEDFHEFVTHQLEAFAIPAHKICFEITETAAITNLRIANLFITKMKTLGCQFALDDFGSGLSSFGYLKELPVEYLKIDGMFVKDIASDPIDLEMVRSINQIGQVMGMKTIAEFVENDQIKDILISLGVNYAQGYGIGKPQPLDELLID